MNYSNHVYLHSYCSSFIIILLIFSLSCLYWSQFFSFFLSLVSASFFLLSHSSFTLCFNGLINLFIGLFFSTYFNGSDQPLLFSFTLCWSSLLASTSAWMGLINLRSDQPWVFAWMGLGFGLIWVSAPINHENEKRKKSQSLGLRDLGFCLMVAGWWWRWLVLRERERERPWVRK